MGYGNHQAVGTGKARGTGSPSAAEKSWLEISIANVVRMAAIFSREQITAVMPYIFAGRRYKIKRKAAVRSADSFSHEAFIKSHTQK